MPWKDNPHNYAFVMLIPFHFGYFTVFVMGCISSWTGAVDCDGSILYPPMMLANDGLFFSLYIISLVLHCNNYFMRWDLDIMPDQHVNYQTFVHNEEQKLKKIQFELKSKRFICWYSFLATLNIIKLCINLPVMKHVPDGVECNLDGSGWCFVTCWLNIPIFVTHIFTTMQTCAIIRTVFIKTSKNKYTCAVMKEDLKHLWGDIYETFWESDNAHHHYMHPSEVALIDAELKRKWPEEYAIDHKKKEEELLASLNQPIQQASVSTNPNSITPEPLTMNQTTVIGMIELESVDSR